MIRTSLLIGVLLILAALTSTVIAAQYHDEARIAASLRSVGNGMMLYAADNKGYLPPDLPSMQKYMRSDFGATMVYVVRPGTRLGRTRQPATQPAAMSVIKGKDEAILVLFLDGRVQRYAATEFLGPTSAPARAQPPVMIGLGDDNTPVPQGVPADVAKALVGAWRVKLDDFVVTYQFKQDGTFALTFVSSQQSQLHAMGTGAATGKWTLDDKKLVMTNTASDTSFTVVGETEEAEIAGLDDNALVLRTTNRRGEPELIVLQRTVAFAKGKRDNEKIVGTWHQGAMTLVLADSGLAVLGPLKGEWCQPGHKLVLVVTASADAGDGGAFRQPAGKSSPTTIEMTVDLVDDTTLVLSGPLLGGREGTFTFFAGEITQFLAETPVP